MPAAMRCPPTTRQQAILDFLADFDASHGYPATFRDVQDHFGFKSANGVLCHLKTLERKGLINRDWMISRGIRLVRDAGKARPRVERAGERVVLSVGEGVAKRAICTAVGRIARAVTHTDQFGDGVMSTSPCQRLGFRFSMLSTLASLFLVASYVVSAVAADGDGDGGQRFTITIFADRDAAVVKKAADGLRRIKVNDPMMGAPTKGQGPYARITVQPGATSSRVAAAVAVLLEAGIAKIIVETKKKDRPGSTQS